MSKQKLDRKRARTWRLLTTVVLLVIGIVILSANRHTFSASLQITLHANMKWFAAVLFCTLLTFFISAFIYCLLSLHPLRYLQTLLVELAASFVGRLLPSGLGGLGLNGVYLYRRGHSAAEATVVTSVNNLLGICAHVLLLSALLFYQPYILSKLFSHIDVRAIWIWAVVLSLALAVFLSLPAMRIKLARFARNLLISLHKEKPHKVLPALLSSMTLTVAYTLAFYCSARAVGIAVGPLQAFVAFSFGVLAGTATPAPGGLVGTEVGLFAGLLSYGASRVDAGASVLLFRLVTYWVPLIPGFFALLSARSRRLV